MGVLFKKPLIAILGLACLTSVGGVITAAVAKDILEGPTPATIDRIIDGDTLEVVAHIWLGQDVRIAVRLAGIDAPEMRGQCEQERVLAVAATDYLKRLVGASVLLTQVRNGKFSGRVLADVVHGQEGDLGAALFAAGLVRAYDGRRRVDWCEQLIATGQATPDQ